MIIGVPSFMILAGLSLIMHHLIEPYWQRFPIIIMKQQSIPSSMPNISEERPSERSTHRFPVYLNVYNFWSCFNRCGACFGLGVYHTGIEIFGDEYMYYGFDGDQTGVGFIDPGSAAYEFGQRVLLGYTNLNYYQIDKEVLEPLRLEFIGNRYDLLNFNCNHFSKRFSNMLGVSEQFPPKIFRITDCCNYLRCCIPNCILNGRLDWFDFSKEEEENDVGHGQYVELKDAKQVKKQEKYGEIIFEGKPASTKQDQHTNDKAIEQKSKGRIFN